jgi:type II secretory pathway component HofQ
LEGSGKILVSPKLIVLSDHEGSIEIGTEEEGQVSLLVTATVLGNGDIVMDIGWSLTRVEGTLPDGQPIVSERSSQTRVRVRSGEGVVVGGLRTDKDEVVLLLKATVLEPEE